VRSQQAGAINGDAQVVGYYWDGTNYQGFLYSNGSFVTVPISCGGSTVAQGINDNGQVVGYDGPWPLTAPQGFVYDIDTTACTVLNYPNSYNTQAYALNDAGQVSGSWNTGAYQANGFVAVP
jgi:probable HAF family extracellular repeat protein